MGRRNANQGNRKQGNSYIELMKEAETLQQRADRRQSEPAAAKPLWEKAAANYQLVLAGIKHHEMEPVLAAEAVEALMGHGVALHGWAEAIMAEAATLPDERHSEEEAAQREALGLLVVSQTRLALVAAKASSSVSQSEAGVHLGNTCCTFAEVSSNVDHRREAARSACDAYATALRLEEDALTHSNLGDALVSLAELICDSSDVSTGTPSCLTDAGCLTPDQLYNEANTHYEAACALSSSEEGDDLPGLLHNWGVGLLSGATHLPLGHSTACEVLTKAQQRFEASAAFTRGDPASLCGIGDTYMAKAEMVAPPVEKQTAVQAALDQGYELALHINSTNTDALLGKAEAHMLLHNVKAEELRGADSSSPDVSNHAAIAATAYHHAISQNRTGKPSPLGLFAARCDTRYNFACAAVHCDRQTEAAQVLQDLLQLRHVTMEDLTADRDLAHVQQQPWFRDLNPCNGQ